MQKLFRLPGRIYRKCRYELDLFLGLMFPSLSLFEGRGKDGESVFVLGTETIHEFNSYSLMDRICEGAELKFKLGRVFLPRFRSMARKYRASMVFVEIRPEQARYARLLSAHRFYLPWMVEIVTDTSPEAERGWSSNLKRAFKKANKAGFSYQVSTEPQDYRDFVENFLDPHRNRAHGRTAMRFDYSFLWDQSQKAPDRDCYSLIKVYQDNQWVTGMLTYYDDLPRFYEIACLDGDQDIQRAGGQAAAYHAFIEEARHKHAPQASLMWCHPYLSNNGVLNYKLQFRPRLVKSDYPSGVLILPGFATQAVTDFFLNNPMIEEYQDSALGVLRFRSRSDQGVSENNSANVKNCGVDRERELVVEEFMR